MFERCRWGATKRARATAASAMATRARDGDEGATSTRVAGDEEVEGVEEGNNESFYSYKPIGASLRWHFLGGRKGVF